MQQNASLIARGCELSPILVRRACSIGIYIDLLPDGDCLGPW